MIKILGYDIQNLVDFADVRYKKKTKKELEDVNDKGDAENKEDNTVIMIKKTLFNS